MPVHKFSIREATQHAKMYNAGKAAELQRCRERLDRLGASINNTIAAMQGKGPGLADVVAELRTVSAGVGEASGEVAEGVQALGGGAIARLASKRAREERHEEARKPPEGSHLKTARQLAVDVNKRTNASELLCAEAEDCVLAADVLRTPHKSEFPTCLPFLADSHVDKFMERHTTAFSRNGMLTPKQAAVCMATSRPGMAATVASFLIARKLVPVNRNHLYKLRKRVLRGRFTHIAEIWGDRGRAAAFTSKEVRALHDSLARGGRQYSRAEFATAVTAALAAQRAAKKLPELADPPTLSDSALDTLFHEVAGMGGVTFSLATRSKSSARCVGGVRAEQ
jgi:hypothetical protein